MRYRGNANARIGRKVPGAATIMRDDNAGRAIFRMLHSPCGYGKSLDFDVIYNAVVG